MEETRTTIKVSKRTREIVRLLSRLTGSLHWEIVEEAVIEELRSRLSAGIVVPVNKLIADAERVLEGKKSRGRK